MGSLPNLIIEIVSRLSSLTELILTHNSLDVSAAVYLFQPLRYSSFQPYFN